MSQCVSRCQLIQTDCLSYNFPFRMTLRKIVGMEGTIDDLSLEVYPRSITLPRSCKAFALYLQKGMQVIGKFESGEGTALKEAFYRFKRPQPACFRIHNLSHSTYTWSLYTISLQSNEETFLDSATFSIQRTIKLYQVQLLQRQREVQTSMREKNITKNTILELWGQLRREMKSSRSVQKCVFADQDYQIEFQVQIKNTLDFQLERLQEEHQMMALRRGRSDQLRNSHSENKNRPPSVIELQSAPYRSASPLKEDMHTKQTVQEAIPVEGEGNDEDFRATVKIVNPLGEQLDEKQQVFEAGTIRRNSEELSQYMMPIPHKKFSLLSDIIEMSHEGSSSYRPDQSSSNGNRITLRKDTAVDFVLQNKPELQVEHLNKFKTLPYEGHHRIQLGDQFRRAQTAQKSQAESQIQESYLSANQQPETHSQGKVRALLDKYSTKWKVIALLAILFGMGAILMTPHKKSRRKSRH